jgi:ureidoacrylate peracid hydrolase
MHTIAISATARERVRARVGKLHPFDTIDPRRTALLVIDMQNYFVKPSHQGEVPMARRIVPNINRLGGELRRRGGHVVWIRNGTAGTRQSWSNYHDGLMTPERMRRRYEAMEEGQEGFEFWHDVPHQDALQRFHSRLLRRRAAPARARCRYRPHRRHRHQHLL